jgi:DNA-binding MarR family transcriptional regulator
VNGKIRKLHRLINQAYMLKFKPFGLRGSMVSMLFIIGKIKGTSQKHLADTLVLDQSTVSRDVKALEKKGWILLKKGSDPRQSSIELTESGCLLLEEVAPLWHELHMKLEEILGSFNIQHIDTITEAIKSNLIELKS